MPINFPIPSTVGELYTFNQTTWEWSGEYWGVYSAQTGYVYSVTTSTGLSGDTTQGNITLLNTAPDQVVTISGGTGILTGGTYPNFSITNTSPDQLVTINDGQYISVTGTYPNFTISTTGITDNDKFTTGFTYDNNTFTLTDNSGNTLTTTINDVTGLTVNGDLTITGDTITDSLSSTTINLTTLPTTDNTEDSFLVRNTTSGEIQIRTLDSIFDVKNQVTVGLPGSVGVDFNSIKDAIDSITGSSSTNAYVVRVGPGVYNENPITMKSYVAILGESSVSTIINANNPNQSLINAVDNSFISDVLIQGCTGTGVSAIMYSSSTSVASSAIVYVENVRFGANYTHVTNFPFGGGNTAIQCTNIKYGAQPFTLGFYMTSDGSGTGRFQLRNVTTTAGGVANTSGLTFAKVDQPNCTIIGNLVTVTKAGSAPVSGIGFHVENGGLLRLNGFNIQRFGTGIYVPQVGSAPTIDAVGLNFENCTTDVDIIHSGTTGKVNGTDSFLKTKININAPLYEVNQDPRQIVVAKKGGDFNSIKDAVDYLAASGNTSTSSRYVISVGPGEFYEDEIDLTNTPYVSIVGSNIQTTQVLPNSNTQHIFKIGATNELSFMSFSGAPVGYSAIYCYDIGNFAQLHKISMYDCDTGILVESVTQDTILYGEYVDMNGEFTNGVKVVGNNGYLALANMENYYSFPTGVGTQYSNFATGSGATINIASATLEGNGFSGSTAFLLQDGGFFNVASADVVNYGYGLRLLNVGNSSSFEMNAVIMSDNTFDISVEQISSSGLFQGIADHTKVTTVSENVFWSFLDSNDGELDITRKGSVTFTDGSHTDFTTLIFEGSTMGLLSGGSLTTVSGFTVQADGGFGYLEKSDNGGIVRRIDWANSLITLSANTDSYVYINENSNLVSSGSKPITSYNILLGRVVTNSTGVEFIDLSPLNAEHTSNRFDSLFTEALGPIYSEGSIVTEGVTPFTLDVTQGDYHYSTNEFLPTGGTNVSFIQYYRNGTGSTWVTSATTLVNNTQYDNNGTLTGLTAGYFTKHTLYTVGEGSYEHYFLVLGQNEYSTLVATEDALLPTPPTYFTDAVVQIANIYIEQGTSGITQIEDIRPTIGFRAGGVNASSVHGNLLGLSADDHTQYLLVSGARAMSGNLDMGVNDITNVGTVDGVIVSAHAARHQFGGLDPVGSVTPSANAIPYADVSGTLNDWVSTASTTTFGKVKTSNSSTTVVSDNDARFLSSFTGGTYSGGTLSLNTNSGGTYNITGFFTGGTDVFVTGATYSNNTFTYTNNTGGTFNVNFNTVTGLTINGDLSVTGNTTVTNGLTANTISADTLTVTNNISSTNRYLYGSDLTPTVDWESGLLTGLGGLSSIDWSQRLMYDFGPNLSIDWLNRTLSDGGEIGAVEWNDRQLRDSVSGISINWNQRRIFDSSGISSISYNDRRLIKSNTFTAFDWENGILTGQTNIQSSTISATTYQNLPTDVRVTGSTYSNNTLTFTNNTGGTFNVNFNTFTGATINGNLSVTGTTTTGTISATTYQNYPTQDLSTTLGYGNSSGVNNISMGSTTSIVSDNTGSQIELDYAGNAGSIKITTDSGAGVESFIKMTTIDAELGHKNSTIYFSPTSTKFNSEFNSVATQDVILIKDNGGGTDITSLSGFKPGVIIGSDSSTIVSGVRNVVIAGGNSITATSSNTLYSYGFNIFNTPTNNNSNTQILSRNTSTGNVEFTSLSYITGLTSGDTFVTGGTYNNSTGTATFTNNSGGSFNVTGFTTGGGTFTGGTVTGPTEFTNGLTANTISATTYLNLTSGNLATVQARRTTGYNLTVSPAFITLNATDVENQPLIVEHDNTNTERIYVYSTGLYLLHYHADVGPGTVSDFEFSLYKNALSVINGSLIAGKNSSTDKVTAGVDTLVELNSGDYVSLYGRYVGSSGGIANNVVLSVTKLEGVVGPQGDIGPQGPAGTGLFTGGTISSPTEFTNGLTANTISAATYLNLPTLTMKSDSVVAGSFTGNPKKYTVTFTTAYPTTNYTIGITGSDNRTFTYESKTTTGFVINTNANTALTGNVDWQTIAIGES